MYAAEVKVIRALQYFWLTSVWGDVPLIDKVISSEEAYGPRNPKEEVVDWMIEDLKWRRETESGNSDRSRCRPYRQMGRPWH